MKAYSVLQINADSAGCCRSGSADGDASSSAGLEAAGLYWRKHRLLLPQGYSMTATQAQAAANPATAEQQDSASADATDAETDNFTGCSAAALQQANQISAIQEQSNAELLQSECDGISSAEHAAKGRQRKDNEHDSLAGAEILMIEDAAELTCDRAAVILRQLSCECRAADSCVSKPEASCSTSAAHEEQQHAAQNQLEADYQSAGCRTDAKASAVALLLPARAQVLLNTPDSPEDQVLLLDKAETMTDSAFHAAGVQWDSDRALASPGGHSSTSRDMSSASLSAATWELNSGRGVSHDTVSHETACPSMEQGLDGPAASAAAQAPAQRGVPSSSFLQRLQMSKYAAASGSGAASPQAEDSRQGKQLSSAVQLPY